MPKNEIIEKQMNDLLKSKIISVNKVERINNDELIWKVIFEGPDHSPYEDGIFALKFIFKQDYPTTGPEAQFITPMFHPNVNPKEDQHVCINILNDWNPKRTIEYIILGIFDILLDVKAVGGYYNDARKSLEKDYDEYYDKVEEYTYKYAKKEYENYNSIEEFTEFYHNIIIPLKEKK